MTDQATRVVPAGWYDDPASPTRVRWWNGIAWTEHVADKPTAEEQAAANARAAETAPAAPQTPAQAAPAAPQHDASPQTGPSSASAPGAPNDASDPVAAARRMEVEFGIGTSETPVVGGAETAGAANFGSYGTSTDDTAWRSTATGSVPVHSTATGSIPAVDGRHRELPDRYLLPDAGSSTGPAWLIAVSPLLTLALGAAVGYVYLFFFPEPILFAAIGIVYFLTLLWALADVRTLRARGLEPASPAFALLGAFVYLIARRVRVAGTGPLVTFLLLAAAAIGAPTAAYLTGVAQPTIIAIEVQDTLNRELVGGGSASSVSCPLVLGSTTEGTTYTCEAVMPDGTDRLVWVSLDSDSGAFSYAYAVN